MLASRQALRYKRRMPRVPTLALLGWLLATPGCTWNPPHVRPPAPAGAPVVVGEDGPLSPRQSENAVDDAVAQARYRERAEALVKAVQAATGTPLITGNRTRLLTAGTAASSGSTTRT